MGLYDTFMPSISKAYSQVAGIIPTQNNFGGMPMRSNYVSSSALEDLRKKRAEEKQQAPINEKMRDLYQEILGQQAIQNQEPFNSLRNALIPDLSKFNTAQSELTATQDREKQSLLQSAAPNKTEVDQEYATAVGSLMQPSQEFQQQIKGREVALRRASGDLLGAQAAMQDPNYVLGSGSALRQKPEPIAPEWTKMNRAARRLRRQGYLQEAGQMASLAEMERLGTPTIDTQEQRNRMSFMDMERDVKMEDQRRQSNLYDLYLRKRKQQEANSLI